MIDEFNPTTWVSVSYPHDHSVSLGNTLSPSNTQEKPQVQVTPEPEHEGATYTLVNFDKDDTLFQYIADVLDVGYDRSGRTIKGGP